MSKLLLSSILLSVTACSTTEKFDLTSLATPYSSIFQGKKVYIDIERVQNRLAYNVGLSTFNFDSVQQGVKSAVSMGISANEVDLIEAAEIILKPEVECITGAWRAKCKSIVTAITYKDNKNYCVGDSGWISQAYKKQWSSKLQDGSEVGNSIKEILYRAISAAVQRCESLEIQDNSSSEPREAKPDRKELFKLAKKCQLKGGVLLNGNCVIEVE